MTPLQEKRLRNVVVALRDAADNPLLKDRFSMRRYGYGTDDLDKNDAEDTPAVEYIDVHKCGTPACALGHFAARRDLQSFLTLDPEDGGLEFVHNNPSCGADYSSPRVKQYFGLDEDEAEDLFDEFGCNSAQTPRMAALYIERFCNRKAKERDNAR